MQDIKFYTNFSKKMLSTSANQIDEQIWMTNITFFNSFMYHVSVSLMVKNTAMHCIANI